MEVLRALATRPKLILLDEPAAGLNESETQQMSELIYTIRDSGITILLVEHDMSLVMKVSDEIVVINYGQKIAEGPPRDQTVIDGKSSRPTWAERWTMLDLRGVNAYYGSIQALKNVFLKVAAGNIVTIIGANGAGKTTLLKAISGIIQSKDGAIWYQDTDITHFSPVKIVSLGISQVPEGRQLFAHLSVLDNLQLGAYLYQNRKFKTEIEEKLDWIYQVFPILRKRSKQLSGTLSGGEQQMVAIARALMARPKLLLLDEPSMGLAPLIVQEIFRVIRQLNDQGTTVLLVEQNARAALQIANYGYVLETGSIALEGPAQDLLADEKVRHAYLGK